MEEIKDGGICPLTGWQISDPHRKDLTWYYTVTCNGFSYNIWVERDCLKSQEIQDFKYLFRWLLWNGRIKTVRVSGDLEDFSNLLTEKKIQTAISESFTPQTPKEKSEQLLISLNKVFPTYKGEIAETDLFNLLFFNNIEELKINLEYLVESNYIIKSDTSRLVKLSDRQSIMVNFCFFKFKFQGIQLLTSLEENGINSKNCFIAMSFSEKSEIVAIKEAIKSAVNETKYNPIIVNEKHIESDRTINDAIIAEIKRSKFVIADFTEQKSGVYFEAGFALGLGIPVIYCCEEEDFKKNSHFDVNHYPHILYKTPEQLRKGLIDKIRAWID
mgnify:CR=1 FL=1|jgi:nucleoside 2-deoxyribosyltransferase